MIDTEASEKEIVLSIASDENEWSVYVSSGVRGGGKFLQNMTIVNKDENGVRGKLPRGAITVRTVKGGEVPKKKRNLTDEQRQAISERFRNYHANKRAHESYNS